MLYGHVMSDNGVCYLLSDWPVCMLKKTNTRLCHIFENKLISVKEIYFSICQKLRFLRLSRTAVFACVLYR